LKAAPFFEHGPAEVISYQESFPDPVPLRHEILVRVDYCGINHLDIWTRQGLPGKNINLPHICGCDIVGHIVQSRSKTKRRVMVYPGLSCHKCAFCLSGRENLCVQFSIIGGLSDHDGGYAELVAVPENNLIDLPQSLTSAAAATLAVSYLTAWNILTTNHAGKKTSILVYGGASGVGMATIQLAKALGSPLVITTASNKNKRTFSRRLGADEVIDTSLDIGPKVLELTGGRGVDLVIDHVGAATWQTSISSVKQGGRMAVCGVTSGNEAKVPIRTFYSKQIIMTGALLGTRSQLVELVKFVVRKKICPVIDSSFQLKEARQAQEKMEGGQHQGKILLEVAQEKM
jgi:NADPH:quinone reductase-like Zn-dependent oxidoreductase